MRFLNCTVPSFLGPRDHLAGLTNNLTPYDSAVFRGTDRIYLPPPGPERAVERVSPGLVVEMGAYATERSLPW